VSLESFPLCCQGAVDQCSAFEECVEILNQRTLVVVPPETKLLVVLHFLNCFVSSFLHRWRKQAKLAINEQADERMRTERTYRVRNGVVLSPVPYVFAIDRPTVPTLSRPPATDYYRAHRAGRRTRESTPFDFRSG